MSKFTLLALVSFIVLFMTSCGALSMPALYQPNYVGPSPLWYSDSMVDHASHLIKSYYEVTGGKELVPMKILYSDPTEAAKLLFFLPDRVVVSHGTQKDLEGPVLNYGNSAALKRWGASWEELTNMPSKYTAEAIEQSARAEFMRTVTENGVVENYSGIRIALDKSRFRILDGTVWNVKHTEGVNLYGQAATFSAWEDL